MKRVAILMLAVALVAVACGPQAAPAAGQIPGTSSGANDSAPSATFTTAPLQAAVAATEPPAATATPTASAAAPQGPVTYGPSNFPDGIDPLTGEPVSDPALLKLPAVLVSVTNFPVSARPQAGLSFASMIFEIYISEGTTRYLAVYHGDFPKATVPDASGTNVDEVGPVRSGRLPYVHIRDAFQWSCLVYASASEQLRAQLRGCEIVYGKDPNDINSAFADVTKLKALALGNAKPSEPFNYTGNLFSAASPAGGETANSLKVFYNYYNQTLWSYDPASGKYLRSQDTPAAPDQFTADTDRLTGEQLAFSNVIVLFAKHNVLSPTVIDIDLGTGTGGNAYLFRDGQAFPIRWSTIGGDYEKQTGLRRPIQFVDGAGNPIALKPGATWVHVVTPFSTVTSDSSGSWLARFYAPAGAK
jgi:hypothetical protein